uniref:Uncharacterized protein n=1 Tax=Tanacetum cinerariifolium TaxID=118510 RepID=A0A699GVM7_TANCI|nr:hypothetical protein [Tanacetum cinerariifolium]
MSSKASKEESTESESDDDDESRNMSGFMVESFNQKKLKKFDFITKSEEHFHLTKEEISAQTKITKDAIAEAAKLEGERRREEIVDLLGPKIELSIHGWLSHRYGVCILSLDLDHVNACTAYKLYYLAIKRKFNFTTMIVYRMEDVKRNNNAPMPFTMLLTRLYKHILETNPQAIVPLDRFMFHECVMDPLDILRNPIKKKGKRVISPLASSSSSSSSFDENKVPSFLKIYEELSENEELIDAK